MGVGINDFTIQYGVGFKIWPPEKDIVIVDSKKRNFKFVANVDGRFVATVANVDYVFQRVLGLSNSKPLFVFCYSNEQVDLWVNGGERLLLDKDSGGEVRQITSSSAQPVPYKKLYSFCVPQNASDVEKLFLNTILDMQEKFFAYDEYKLLRAAHLLRQVFLDGHISLYDCVKGENNAIFKVVNNNIPSSVTYASQFHPISPANLPGAKTLDIGKDDFLSTVCVELNGTNLMVKDIILACSNGKGGVHLGPITGKRRKKEKELVLSFDEIHSFTGREPSLIQLRDICEVTLIGLQPIVQSILDCYDGVASAQ